MKEHTYTIEYGKVKHLLHANLQFRRELIKWNI